MAIDYRPLWHLLLDRNMKRTELRKHAGISTRKLTKMGRNEDKDLIGRVYEYFLKEFAVNATKEEGEYYTQHDVVQLSATLIEPFDGTLYDMHMQGFIPFNDCLDFLSLAG